MPPLFNIAIGKPSLGQGWIHIELEPQGKVKLDNLAQPAFLWHVYTRKLVYKGQNIWNDTPVLVAVKSKAALCSWLKASLDTSFGSGTYLKMNVYTADGKSLLGQWIMPANAAVGSQGLGC